MQKVRIFVIDFIFFSLALPPTVVSVMIALFWWMESLAGRHMRRRTIKTDIFLQGDDSGTEEIWFPDESMTSSNTLDYEQFLQPTTNNPMCLDLQDVEPDTYKLNASILTDLHTYQHISQEAPTDSESADWRTHGSYCFSGSSRMISDQPMALHHSVSKPPEDDTNELNAPSIVRDNFTLDQNLQSLDDVSKLVELPNFIPIPRQRFFWEIFSGPNFPLTQAVLDSGIPCIRPFDIQLNKDFNILDNLCYELMLRIVAARLVANLHGAPPCTEYSLLKLKRPGPPPCRSPDCMNSPMFDNPGCHERFFSSREIMLENNTFTSFEPYSWRVQFSGITAFSNDLGWRLC